MIYLAADHRGFSLKEVLKKRLFGQGYAVKDAGAFEIDVEDDYPDFAEAAVEALIKDSDKDARAILICGSGHGMDMIANKHQNMRAALCFNVAVAKQSREHEDANVLVLASDWTKEHDAFEIVKVWLDTPFGNAERNIRRLQKIHSIEELNFK